MKRITSWMGMVFLVLLAVPDLSFAQVTDPEQLFFEEIPTVITATKREQKVFMAPASISVITEDQIKERGYRNLLDVLQMIPGFFQTIDNNEMTGGMRGMYASTTSKIAILIDNHKLLPQCIRNFNLDNYISFDEIKRIEVIRGPISGLYGSNSFAGLINIITKTGKDVDGLNVSASHGSWKTKEYQLMYGKEIDEDIDVMLSFGYFDSDGERKDIESSQDIPLFPGGQISGVGNFPDMYTDNYAVHGKLRYHDFSLTFFRSLIAHIPPRTETSAVTKGEEEIDILYKDVYNYAVLTYQHDWDNGISFRVSPYVDLVHHKTDGLLYSKEHWPPIGYYGKDVNLKYDKYGVDFDLKYAMDKHTLSFGGEYESFKWKGYDGLLVNPSATRLIPGNDSKEKKYSFYIQEEWVPVDKLSVTANLLVDAGSFIDTAYVPRLALAYNYYSSHFLKLIFSEAFVAPSWFARVGLPSLIAIPLYVPNSDLDREQIKSYEVVLMGYLNRWEYDVSVFMHQAQDFINTRTSDRVYVNLDRAKIWGVEAEVNYAITEDLRGFVNYTYNDSINEHTSDVFLHNGDLINVPKHMVKGGINYYFLEDYSVDLRARWHSRLTSPITAISSPAYDLDHEIASNVVVDFVLTAERPFNIADSSVQLIVYNFLDKDYTLGGSVPIPYQRPGRQFVLKIQKKF